MMGMQRGRFAVFVSIALLLGLHIEMFFLPWILSHPIEFIVRNAQVEAGIIVAQLLMSLWLFLSLGLVSDREEVDDMEMVCGLLTLSICT